MSHPTLRTLCACLVAAFAAAVPLAAGAAGADELSLEDLLTADVVTASRKAQAVQDVPAAVYVISRDDIERSGATSLPEALRLAPGVEVGRLASGRWAVSARGFNGRFANKLLVLMDGRSLYSPLFSGVMWEMEGTLLEDVDRIEVIRGPGAAMWGANAVNGVINILTRHARDTQGTLLALGTGSIERGAVALRHGGTLPRGFWRAWFQADAHRGYDGPGGVEGNDAGHGKRAGLRADLALDGGQALSVSGALSDDRAGDRWYNADLLSPTGMAETLRDQLGRTAHLLARYSRLGDDCAETVAQTFIERSQLEVAGAFGEFRTTVDLDLQHRPRPWGAHDLVFGATWRRSSDLIHSGNIFLFEPSRGSFTVASVFANDEITLLPETLRATLGARLEHNSYTGWEPQPQLRLAWTPSRTQTVWGALSRAVRTPSRAERDVQVDLSVTPAAPPVPAVLLRNMPRDASALIAERLDAVELGYRQQLAANLSLDFTAFHHRYADIDAAHLAGQSFEMAPVPHVVQQIQATNRLAGRSNGIELALDWRASRQWRVQGSYSRLGVGIDVPSGDPVEVAAAAGQVNSAPRQQWLLRSSLSLGAHEIDVRLRHAGALQQGGFGAARVEAYTACDARWAWRLRDGLSLALSAENLFDPSHTEAITEQLPSQPLQVPRSVHAKLSWLF